MADPSAPLPHTRVMNALRPWGRRLRWPYAVALYVSLLLVAAGAAWSMSGGPEEITVTATEPAFSFEDESDLGFEEPDFDFDEPVTMETTMTTMTVVCPMAFGVLESRIEADLRRLGEQLPPGSFAHEHQVQRAARCRGRERDHAVAGGLSIALGLVVAALSSAFLRSRGSLVVVDPRAKPLADVTLRPSPEEAVDAMGRSDELPRCARCGWPRQRHATSGLAGLEGSANFCGSCRAARATHSTVVSLAVSIVVAVAGASAFAAGDTEIGPYALGFGLFVPAMCAQIVPHELGHAAVGRLLGLRVPIVNFGMGSMVRHVDVGRTRFAVRSVPSGGSTALLSRSATAYRLRWWLAVTAGPLVQVLLMAWAFTWSAAAGSAVAVVRAVVLLSALVLLVVNLIPREVHGLAPGLHHTDGWLMLEIPRLSPADVERRVARERVTETIEAGLRAGRQPRVPSEDLQRLVGAVRVDTEEDRLLVAVAAVFDDRFADAAALSRSLLADAEPGSFVYISALNLLAWSHVLAGTVEPGQEADTASVEAYRLAPDEPAVCGTRGSVLIDVGRPEDGLVLLEVAGRGAFDGVNQALNRSYMAIGLAAVGDATGARAELVAVEDLDPDCRLLPRVRRRLGVEGV